MNAKGTDKNTLKIDCLALKPILLLKAALSRLRNSTTTTEYKISPIGIKKFGIQVISIYLLPQQPKTLSLC